MGLLQCLPQETGQKMLNFKLTFLLALFLFENSSRQNAPPLRLCVLAWNRARHMLLLRDSPRGYESSRVTASEAEEDFSANLQRNTAEIANVLNGKN